jgi:flagellar biosynthesis protein FliR
MATYLNQFLLLLAGCPRIIGMIALVPGLDAAFVPPLVRLGLAGGVGMAMGSLIARPSPAVLALTPEGYLLMLLGELALGAVIGFCLSCLLEAARLAGELVDLQIGFRAGELYDPLGGTSSSILGRLWYLAALVFFFQVNGHHWLIAGLARSYEVCPVGALVYQRQVGLLAGEMVLALFALSLRIAAPVVASLILADLTLGLVGRGMPQMNILLVGMPAKILVGLVALACCSPLMASSLGQVGELWRQAIAHLLTVLH